jgi:hypothetical protein
MISEKNWPPNPSNGSKPFCLRIEPDTSDRIANFDSHRLALGVGRLSEAKRLFRSHLRVSGRR